MRRVQKSDMEQARNTVKAAGAERSSAAAGTETGPVIIHSGDLHLGAGGKNAEKKEERFAVLAKLLDLVRREKADALLLAGDFLEQGALAEAELMRVRTMLADVAADCPIFITPGNHDPADPLSPYRRKDFWPAGVKIFLEPETVVFPEKGFSLTGAGFRQIYQREELLPGMIASYEQAAAAGQTRGCPAALAVMHAEIKQGADGLYNPLDLSKLAASPFHYLALGHVHAPDYELRQAGKCFFAFCGAPQGNSKKDLGERGCRLLRLSGERLVESRFVPLAVRVYRPLTVKLDGAEDAAEALKQIRAEIERAAAGLPDEKTQWTLRLEGESAGSYIPRPEALRQALQREGLLLSKIEDKSRARIDEAKLAEEDSLRGLFFRDMKREIAAAEGEQKALYEEALRLGLDAFRGELTD